MTELVAVAHDLPRGAARDLCRFLRRRQLHPFLRVEGLSGLSRHLSRAARRLAVVVPAGQRTAALWELERLDREGPACARCGSFHMLAVERSREGPLGALVLFLWRLLLSLLAQSTVEVRDDHRLCQDCGHRCGVDRLVYGPSAAHE